MQPFDFRVKGVTSISVDTHKVGSTLFKNCEGQKSVNDYREVQLDLTPEIEVFYMMLEGCHTNNRKRSLKQ